MTDPLAILGAVGGFIGVASIASQKWRGSNREERNDHQACLERLAEHIERADKRSDEHDNAIAHLRDEHSSCREHLVVLRSEVESLRRATTKIQKSISPTPFPKVTP